MNQKTSHRFITSDAMAWLCKQSDNVADLIFCSPPYESARSYDIGFNLKGEEYVEWCFHIFKECCRVSKGLVAWIIEGQTTNFQWSATPALLKADLHRAGIKLRKPPAFFRHGIPGSGGPDFLRNDYESIICASDGRLPWSDNTAMGKPCKYKRGGDMTNRLKDGNRRDTEANYQAPKLANPGNVIYCRVGGGHMGSKLAHENEAPFPESLAEFFIKSFCPPGGTVVDIFSGSGTTIAAAYKCGRSGIGIDIRESQTKIGRRRLKELKNEIMV